MRPTIVLLVAAAPLLGAPGAWAFSLQIAAEPYGRAGLYARPVIPAEGDTVTICVEAAATDLTRPTVPAELTIVRAGARPEVHRLELAVGSGRTSGEFQWEARRNGEYTVTVLLDPDNVISAAGRARKQATLTLPVVIPGRRPHFPWYMARDHLRWATIWAGSWKEDEEARWKARGVLPLLWQWGNNKPEETTEEEFYTLYKDTQGTAGLALDECGYQPETLQAPERQPKMLRKFRDCLNGLARAKQEDSHAFYLIWHYWSLYPEQVAMYRKACDLLVLESYTLYYDAKRVSLDNQYDFLRTQIGPARQVDSLQATGRGMQVVAGFDLHWEHFNRGELENHVRFIRRNWPEMRGLGFFGWLRPDNATPAQEAKAVADECFADRLCYEYFVRPVVTLQPGNLWLTRAEDGYRVEAAVSNIGGMDAGPVTVGLYTDGKLIREVVVPRVPAGDNFLENRAVASAAWPDPPPGAHTLGARILRASSNTVLDAAQTLECWVPASETGGC